MQWATLVAGRRSSSTGSIRRSRCGSWPANSRRCQQTMVSFARALANEAQVLILDEPTASLTDTEIKELFAVLRSLRRTVWRSSTCRTGSRRSSSSATGSRSCATARPCSRRTWRTRTSTRSSPRWSAARRRAASRTAATRDLDGGPHRRGLSGRRVQDVSFTAHAGEVLGIGGLAGRGAANCSRILAARRSTSRDDHGGETPLPHSAGVAEPGRGHGPRSRRAASQGVILSASIQDNVALANIAHGERARHGLRWAHRRHHRAG